MDGFWKHSSILARHVITYSRDELPRALFHVWSCLTLFCLFVSLLEMDHRFMHTCSSLCHSSCCLVGLSPQVGHNARELFSTRYLLVFPVHITFIRWNLWSRVTIPTDCWSFTVFAWRYRTFFTCRRWPISKENLPAVELPATKQDTTEVQWDLSWMEMSNLLDKHLYPGT